MITWKICSKNNRIHGEEAELQELAEQWKKRGLIRKYVIADDELINDKLTSVTDNEVTVALEKTKNIEIM